MKVLILSFSNNQVNEDSFIPNKIGLTFSCVEDVFGNVVSWGTSGKLEHPIMLPTTIMVRNIFSREFFAFMAVKF